MTIRCIDCGKFIPLADMERKLASFQPEMASVPEREIGWTCAECVLEAEQHGPREAV
jgi:hypothetical protein